MWPWQLSVSCSDLGSRYWPSHEYTGIGIDITNKIKRISHFKLWAVRNLGHEQGGCNEILTVFYFENQKNLSIIGYISQCCSSNSYPECCSHCCQLHQRSIPLYNLLHKYANIHFDVYIGVSWRAALSSRVVKGQKFLFIKLWHSDLPSTQLLWVILILLSYVACHCFSTFFTCFTRVWEATIWIFIFHLSLTVIFFVPNRLNLNDHIVTIKCSPACVQLFYPSVTHRLFASWHPA